MQDKIAIYLRLSLEDTDKRTDEAKDESNSIAAQRNLVARFLDMDPLLRALPQIEFCDDGFSGTNFDRPAFRRMIDLVRRGEISTIIVKDLSRFGRDYIEVGDYLEHIFPFLGIRIISINDHYDSAKYTGKTIGMDMAFKNLIYDYYSKDLSKKVRSAMGVKQKRARYLSCILYGYKRHPTEKHQMVIDPETAPVVRRIFLDVIAGVSTTEIAKSLNDEGVLTPAQYKASKRENPGRQPDKKPHWTHRTILTMIENIKYTGTMVNHIKESRYIRDKNQRRVPKEEWYIRENAHEAIVTKEEFDTAQAVINRRKSPEKHSHDQSDRIYYCGHCGHKLEKQNGNTYACASRRLHENTPCSEVRLRKPEIEEAVFEALKAQVVITRTEAREIHSTYAATADKLRKRLIHLQADGASCGREKFSLYEQYRSGSLTAAEYMDQKKLLIDKQDTIQAEVSRIETEYQAIIRETEAADCAEKKMIEFSHLSDNELRMHMYDAIERITVYNKEDIEITWKFDDISYGEKSETAVEL